MEKFKISDIQELFAGDLDRFHSLTQAHVGRLLAETPVPVESLEEALRQAHTLKGLTAMVGAYGLSCWGADIERLLELAGTWVEPQRAQANEIFQFILDHSADWYVMNQFTSMELLPQAWDVYIGLRAQMEEKWGGYLPKPEAADVEGTPVRLGDRRTSEILDGAQDPSLAPTSDSGSLGHTTSFVRPTPPSVTPPPLQRRAADNFEHPFPAAQTEGQIFEIAASSNEPIIEAGSAATPAGHSLDAPADSASEGAPRPLEVVPPPLKRAAATPRIPQPDLAQTPPAEEIAPVAPEVLANSAAPLAEPVAASPTDQIIQSPPAEPAAQSPLLRVAPPNLKRRAPKRAAAATVPTEGAEAFAAAATPVPQETKPAPLLPAIPEPVVAAAAPAETFKPSADKDLLELLAEEVAGYLVDLTGSLGTLAVNLDDQAEWEKTRRLFHTIKGTAATFQLDAVSGPAKAAEARCIVAVEDAATRTKEAFETCIHRAQIIAKALRLPFEDQPLLAALENALVAAPVAEAAAVQAIDPEMAEFFIRDARDQVQTIEQAVLLWEKGEAVEDQVWAAQRGFHTLKGAANAVGLTSVADSVHEVEAFLEGAASAGATGSKPLFTFLLGAVDQIRGYLNELVKNASAPWRHGWRDTLRLLSQPADIATTAATGAVAATSAAADDEAEDEAHTVRIEASRLYQLMNLIGEMVVDRARLGKKIEDLTKLHRALAERNGALTGSVQTFQQQFEFNLLQDKTSRHHSGPLGRGTQPISGGGGPGGGEFSELEFDRYDQFNVLARSLIEISHDIEQLNEEVAGCLDSFAAESVRFNQTSQELQGKVTSLSLVPVSRLFPRLQRAFRDALDVEHKEADLTLAGGEALLDKVVIDRVYAPLLHLLRNSVSHGIEDAVTREKLAKPARGQVRLSAAQVSNQIVIQVSDDGGGVNPEAVRRRAIQKGWLAADAPPLTADQVLHFIFQPGFSTAAKVTSVSGRGIGLDVVRKEIESLNGSVELRYEAERGSTWTLRLPLTLSISEAILAEGGGFRFAFPLNFIEAGLVLDEAPVRDANGLESYRLGEASVPVVRLSKLLQLPGQEDARNGLIVSVGDRRAIVIVDRVLARQEIVIKHLDSLTAQHPLLNGATLDAEGLVIPILNLPTLLKFGDRAPARENRPKPTAETARPAGQLRVLIVDDSLSVRKVQERFLTDLGCEVVSAADGLLALERLREKEFDFVFTDLEMPRLNGYELITELQGNPAWSTIPVVVISSRGADKYITKAMNLGAATFLSKPFTQQQLQQVLGHYSKSANVTRSSLGPNPILQGAA